MKKTLLTIFVISYLFNIVKGQDFTIRLFVTDSNNRKDTIELGLNYFATMGIDSFFGEQDIYGQPWDSLDMRIIQRDSLYHHCLRTTHWLNDSNIPELYFPINSDLKNDFRPLSGAFGTINLNFEILIKSTTPPIVITTDFSGISWNMYEGWSVLHLLDLNCNTVETRSIYFTQLNDTIYTSNDTLTTLVAEFQHEVSVDKNNWYDIKIFPNPTQTEIIVQANIPIYLKLYDIFGKKIKECKGGNMDIKELNKGLYFISVFDENGNCLKAEKVIKD